MKNPLRVHICPIGFEVLRVVEPLIQMRADKAYLMKYHDKPGSSFALKVRRTLKQENRSIEVVEETLNLWDLFDCITSFKQIIQRERENLVFINVSTGTKVTAIAGTLVSMLMGTTPYYAKVKYGPQQFRDLPTVGEPFVIPVYKILSPEAEALKILELVGESKGSLRKRELILKLKELEIIRPVGKPKLSPSAAHNQLRALLVPLEKMNFIHLASKGRASFVELTEDGRNALKVFR